MTTFGQRRTAVTSANRPGLFSHEERSRWLPVRSTLVAITAALLMFSVNAARDGIAQEVVLQPHDTMSLPAWNSLVLAALENRRIKGRNDQLSRLFREQQHIEDLKSVHVSEDWNNTHLTLQTYDYAWFGSLASLERGDLAGVQLIQNWQQMPATSPFQANGMLPGDFVVLRDGRNKIRVLVYAGKGTCKMDKKPEPVPIDKKPKPVPDKKPILVLRDFFYYSWLADRGKPGDPDYRQGVRKLQLNTYPPKISREIAKKSVSKKTRTQVPQKVFAGNWMCTSIVTSKQPQCNRQNMQSPIGWNKQASGTSYCVVRMKPGISLSAAVGPNGLPNVERDVRRAIVMADHAAKIIREPTSQSRKVFELAFGVDSPTLQQREHAAGIYDAFRGHLVKGMIVEDSQEKKIAHVRPGARWIVFVDPPYFGKKKDEMRASILIHEFCHAWGYRGHPGTGDYSEHNKIVQAFLKSRTMQSHSGLIPNSLYEMHRMVSVDEEKNPAEVNGFLNWEDAHLNAYSYGNFALWLWQQTHPEKQK